jgi:hypothetical protein
LKFSTWDAFEWQRVQQYLLRAGECRMATALNGIYG